MSMRSPSTRACARRPRHYGDADAGDSSDDAGDRKRRQRARAPSRSGYPSDARLGAAAKLADLKAYLIRNGAAVPEDFGAWRRRRRALRVLAADPGAASTRRVAVAALHMYSRFDDFELDSDWAPLASSAAVFLPGSTKKATWAQYAADEWKWPFLHASSDADLAVVLVECARVTGADAGLGRHGSGGGARRSRRPRRGAGRRVAAGDRARVNRRRGGATDDVDLFLAAERALAADAAAAGHPAPHGALEAGDAAGHRPHRLRPRRAVFRPRRGRVRAPPRADLRGDLRRPRRRGGRRQGALAPRTVLDAYLGAEAGARSSSGARPALFDERAKARTPRAFAPPPARPLDRAPAAARAGRRRQLRQRRPAGARAAGAASVKATSVLMGYAADRFTRAAGLVNDAAASWRALGNTIQKGVLASVVAPHAEDEKSGDTQRDRGGRRRRPAAGCDRVIHAGIVAPRPRPPAAGGGGAGTALWQEPRRAIHCERAMAPPLEILCITTGGSIDKTYSSLASDFVCAAPVLKGLLRDVKCAHRVAFREICRKDSLELTDGDRDAIVAAVAGAAQTHVLVTHGTDTLWKTAR
ncbi:hypothetical protein JL720_10023 [Aureococcus anophagefferens]|nr:hypothetical protein JL720_10023 [Aureococcus anophagefferens]